MRSTPGTPPESGLTSGGELWKALKPLHDDRAAAKAQVQTAMTKVAALPRRMTQALADAVAAQAEKQLRSIPI